MILKGLGNRPLIDEPASERDSVLNSKLHKTCYVTYFQFFHHAVAVGIDCLRGNRKNISDCLTLFTFNNKLENFLFTAAED